MLISCPSCKSKQIVKNGKIHNGKQNYRCRDCGRQFVENRQQKIISQPTKNLIDKLLLEKIPLAGEPRLKELSRLGQSILSQQASGTSPLNGGVSSPQKLPSATQVSHHRNCFTASF